MKNIWLSKVEIAALPTTGTAWDTLKSAADKAVTVGTDILSNQDSPVNVAILAKALMFAKTGQQPYLVAVLGALRAIANGVSLGRALALGRELAAYVISADLIDLENVEPTLHASFSAKIRSLLTEPTSGGPANLTKCQEQRPNNWGMHASASRIAVACYLGDTTELDKAAAIFKGWLGDRAAYAGFTYGDVSWQADPSSPVGINPVGATIQGHNVDGVLPDDMRRGGSFTWPPPGGDGRMYSWEALQGAITAAQLLARAGYDAWNWSDKALLRAVQFLYNLNWTPGGDDGWQPWLINYAYDTNYPALPTASPGKNMGWTQWTHAAQGVKPPPPPPPPPPPDTTDAQKIANALAALKTVQAALADVVAGLGG